MRVIYAVLTTLIIALLTHVSAHAAEPSLPVCQIASEGIFNGFWVKHRIVVEDEVVYGANDMDSILSQLESLREEGLCR